MGDPRGGGRDLQTRMTICIVSHSSCNDCSRFCAYAPESTLRFLKALHSLHDAHWLHGDLRSGNVMLLDESDQVRRSDYLPRLLCHWERLD